MNTFTQVVRNSLNDIIPIIQIHQLPVPGSQQWAVERGAAESQRSKSDQAWSTFEQKFDRKMDAIEELIKLAFPEPQQATTRPRAFQGTDLIIKTQLPTFNKLHLVKR